MKFLNLLILLFLFPHIDVSSSSSCEEFQNIFYNLPFRKCWRVTSFPGNNIQVDCEGNNPIIYMQSTKFLVKDISFENKTFRLVDSSYYSTQDPCHLPTQTISEELDFLSYFYNFFGHTYYSYGRAETNHNYAHFSYLYFVNCTQEIENSRYRLVPCLNRTNFRVYAMASGSDPYPVSHMHDSCSLVGCAVTEYMDESLGDVGYAAIMQAIQKGVLVNWTYRSSESCSNTDKCLRRLFNPWLFEQLIGSIVPYEQWMDNMGFRASEVLFLLRPASFLLLLPYWMSSLLGCLYDSSSVVFIIKGILSCIILIILLARMVLTPVAICSFFIQKWWGSSSSISTIEKFLRKNELLHIRRYDFIEISIMTNHFKEKLGQGGFGSVYKGKLLSGHQVAVKILSNPVGDGDDFISEVATIGRIHHTNIVRLIGFCSEDSKRALIYAYMPNGSLDKYIFSSSNNALSMEKRREIAIGIARGIDYLHRGCEMQILHFDIKPHNILLDHNLIPKISDFGLARLYPRDYSLVTLSMARGTIGYIAPELISRTFGTISYKADVYSFGMLLMEMVSGRRNVNNHAESSGQVYYPSWIYHQLNLPAGAHYLSSNVPKFGEIEESLYKVALWCVQMKASNRPTMNKVIQMLQNDANSLEMPPPPSMICTPHEFCVRPSGNESCSIELSLIRLGKSGNEDGSFLKAFHQPG